MPDDDADGTIETGQARLPAAKRPAPATRSDEMTPALSDEDLDERQRRLGTKRKPAGPPLDGTRGNAAAAVDDTPSDVPETDVTELVEVDPAASVDDDGGDNGDDNRGSPGSEPLESSERE